MQLLRLCKFSNHMPKHQRGLTLIELMVGIAVGLLVLIIVANIYMANIKATRDNILANNLDSTMRSAMALMAEEIRRAGYWAGITTAEGVNLQDLTKNPFTQTSTPHLNLLLGEDAGMTVNSCITFSYDGNQDGKASDATADERRDHLGFKLVSDAGVGVIRFRDSSNLGDTGSCTTGLWGEAITDKDIISIDALTFSLAGSQCVNTSRTVDSCAGTAESCPVFFSWNSHCSDFSALSENDKPVADDLLIEKRMVSIRLTASLLSDPAVTGTLQERLQVRNHRVFQYAP